MSHTMCSRCEEKPAAICISCLTDCTLKQQPPAGKQEIIEILEKAEAVILRAENMCMASDGPVSPTITEMSDDDIKEIYKAVHQALTKLREAPEQPPVGEFTKEIRQIAKLNFESHNYGEKIIAHIDRNLIYDLCDRLDSAEAENKQLKGEEPIPYAWWKECPKLAQKTMERIIARNDELAARLGTSEPRQKTLETINADLLKACKRMLGAMGCDELNNGRVFDDDLRKEVKEQARAAITKAKKEG